MAAGRREKNGRAEQNEKSIKFQSRLGTPDWANLINEAACVCGRLPFHSSDQEAERLFLRSGARRFG